MAHGGLKRHGRILLTATAAVALGAGGVVLAPPAWAGSTCGGLRATIVGTSGSDALEGTAGRDVIAGLGGADFIDGRGGDDVVCGGGGGDTVAGGDGQDRLLGNTGDDTLDGGNGADRLSGGNGADRLTGDAQTRSVTRVRSADDDIAGGPGHDTVVLWKHRRATGNIRVDLAAGTARGQGRDTLHSVEGAYVDSEHADVLLGSPGDDSFFSGGGADVERGLGGDDRFFAADGDDRHDGGTGSDTIDMSMTYQAVVSLVSGTARSTDTGTDTLIAVENASGSEGDDVLTGDLAANVLEGRGGQDVLRGLAGDDVLRGGGNSSVADQVDSLAGGPGDDLIDGGGDPAERTDNRDEVDYTSSDTAVAVDLAAGTATGEGDDTLVRVEDVVGSAATT